MIGAIQDDYPDVQFSREAFTHPKMMRDIGQGGFHPVIHLFHRRNFKWDLTEYMQELTQGPMREYFRGNLFANIAGHPAHHSAGGRSARIRDALRAGGHALLGLRHLQRLRAVWKTRRGTSRQGGVSRLGKYECKVELGAQGEHQTVGCQAEPHSQSENPALHEYDNLEFW